MIPQGGVVFPGGLAVTYYAREPGYARLYPGLLAAAHKLRASGETGWFEFSGMFGARYWVEARRL